MSDSLYLWPHRLQLARVPCPSLSLSVCSYSCPLSRWCHPTVSSVVPFSHLQSFPASGSFLVSQFLTSDGQSIGALAPASVLPVNIQGWFPLGNLCDLCPPSPVSVSRAVFHGYPSLPTAADRLPVLGAEWSVSSFRRHSSTREKQTTGWWTAAGASVRGARGLCRAREAWHPGEASAGPGEQVSLAEPGESSPLRESSPQEWPEFTPPGLGSV